MIQAVDDLLADLLHEHPAHNAQRLLVGVSQTPDEPGLDAGIGHGRRDPGAAPVDEDRVHPDLLHEDHVRQ